MKDIFLEEENGLSINLNRISKGELKSMADKIADVVKDGNANPLEEYIKAKALIEFSNNIVAMLKNDAYDQAYRYVSNGEKVLGCDVIAKNTPAQYDFSHNEEWVKITEKIEELKKAQKSIESEMINAIGYSQVVSPFGEVILPAKVKKESGSTIQITIPK